MHFMKQYSSLLLAVVLTGFLIGCGGASEAGGDNNMGNGDDTSALSEFADALDYNISVVQADSINLSPDNLIDYYKVNFNTTGRYTFYLESLTSGTNIDYTYRLAGAVHDSQGAYLDSVNVGYQAFNSIGNENNIKEVDITIPGTYYLKFYRAEFERIVPIATSYKFHIEPSTANGLSQNSDHEYNDVQSQAAPLQLVTFQVDVNGTLNTERHTDHNDWYKLENLQIGKYTVFMKTKAGTVFRAPSDSMMIDVYNSNGINLTNYRMDVSGVLDNADRWQRKVFEVITVGDYYLKFNREYDLAATYSFKVVPSIANGYVLDADAEPNDEIHLAKNIILTYINTTIENSVMITDTLDSDDWFKFTADVSQDINITLKTLPGTQSGTYSLKAEILNKYGVIINTLPKSLFALSAANQEESDTFAVTSGDDYYIHIHRVYNLPSAYRVTLAK